MPFKVWNQQNPNEKYKISFKSNVSPNLPMHCIAMGDIVGLARFHKKTYRWDFRKQVLPTLANKTQVAGHPLHILQPKLS